jgi:quercetin dioxygenase-like cupin family protein
MTRSGSFRWVFVVLGTCLLAGPLASGQSAAPDRSAFIAAQPEDMRAVAGGTQVVLYGDPTKPGLYVVRNTFPPGRIGTPHFHTQDRHVTVLKGTWWVSLGPESDSGDASKMVPMKAGSYVFHPANGHHFDGAKDEEAVVQIIGMGPVATTQLKPAGRGANQP